MTVLASSSEVSTERLKTVEEIFSSVGRVLVLDEHSFDAVTGLSGSGRIRLPGHEGSDGCGIKKGLPEESRLPSQRKRF